MATEFILDWIDAVMSERFKAKYMMSGVLIEDQFTRGIPAPFHANYILPDDIDADKRFNV